MRYYNPTPQQITAWVTKHFDVKSRKDGSELVICNPFDGDEGFHFNISIHKGLCHDWRGSDEWAGPKNPRTNKRACTFLNLVRKFLNCSYHEAARAIAAASGSAVPSVGADGRGDGSERDGWATEGQGGGIGKEKPLVDLPAGSEEVHKSTQNVIAVIVRNWLESRGVSKELSAMHNIHHLGVEVVFPYYEFGSLVYWQTRSAINKTFRFPDEKQYIATKSDFIYNFDGIEPASYIIVAEAIFGCYSLGAQACATGGADISNMQIRKIKLLGPRDGTILAPDNDGAGIKSVLRNGQKLQAAGLQTFFSIPPRIPYRDSEGKERTTKDWNELYTGAKLSLIEIRGIFEDGVKPLDARARFQLSGMIGAANKTTLQQAAAKKLRMPS